MKKEQRRPRQVRPTCCIVFQKNSLSNGIEGIDATRLAQVPAFHHTGSKGTVSCAGFVQSASMLYFLFFCPDTQTIPTPRASPFSMARVSQLSHSCPSPLPPALASINSILIAVDPAVPLPRTKLSSRDQRFHCVLVPRTYPCSRQDWTWTAGIVHHSVHGMRRDCTV